MAIELVEVQEPLGISDYEEVLHLVEAVRNLRLQAETVAPLLSGRRVWMVNSTSTGGGVAEMLPKMISLLRELGIETEWAVIGSDRPEFFGLTKRIHNLIHGAGKPTLSAQDRELYEAVSRDNAAALLAQIRPNDVLIIHDPQPLGAGAIVKKELALPAIWRCHIGIDQIVPATQTVWEFLEPYVEPYDHAVFSAPEYIPDYLAGRSTIVYPAIDPLSDKNRELDPHKITGVVCNGGLAVEHAPVVTSPFENRARRLDGDGEWVPANGRGEIGLLYRPTVTQISRWDRLKGFAPLLEAFVHLKRERAQRSVPPLHRRRLDIVRLLVAGPDPRSVADDPEGSEVLDDLSARYLELPMELQDDVVLVALPMASRRENALMVNALQRCSTVVVQNSLQEGFGLTVTEAMWKRKPVLGSTACGIRHQIRDGVDGRLVADPSNHLEVAALLDELLSDPVQRKTLSMSAQRRVHRNFLVFTQLGGWLQVIESCLRQR